MKKFLVCAMVFLITICVVVGLTTEKDTSYDGEVLRIHIRANSNVSCDQSVKYKVKDALVDYLIPLLENVETKQDVENVVVKNKSSLENVANNILKENGFNYVSNIKLCNEEFPTRSYNGLTLENGFYDAVIVELGEATGNNWWCVIYPPICFTNYSNKKDVKVVYKSKILEIIDKLINGRDV